MLENSELKNKLIHHRGLRKDQTKPNSLDGVYYEKNTHLECDVFLLSDGQVGVIHNKDHDLTCEQVESMTLEQTKAPFLEEFLKAQTEQNNQTIIEMKASTPEHAIKTAQAVMRLLDKLPKEYSDLISLHSFSVEAIKEVGDRYKKEMVFTSFPKRSYEQKITETVFKHVNYDLDWTSEDWVKAYTTLAAELGCFCVHIFQDVITKELVDFAHSKGLLVYTGLINDPSKFDYYLSLGADKIFTEV